MAITLKVKDAAQIGRLVNRLGQVQSVIEVRRG
jgi:(p)ppGpp synthase/HD superfamily hydrolase